MIVKTSISSLGHRSLRLGCVSLAAFIAATAAARADDCPDVETTAALTTLQPCENYGGELDLSTPSSALSQPQKPAPKSDGIPWIATDTNDIPATFSTTDTSVSVRTSLGTLRDYNKRSASVTIEQPAFGEAPKPDFVMPAAPVTRKTPLDVWTNVDLSGYNGSPDQSTRAGVGADYNFNKATKVGVSIEGGDTRNYGTSGVVEDQKASAYVTLQATPLLSLDARTQWQTGNAEFAETTGAGERSSFVLAPKINHDFKLDDGSKLSPYLSYQREFDLSTTRKDGVDTSFDGTQSVGAGVTFTDPNAYSLSVSAGVDNFGVADESQSVSSKLQLNVPLNK
ncbi:MAG: hypothetical protein JSR78_07040 [Proteobacteria bacterium]|nr:hypothetical protein [Pseudomonadota bacterium]